MIFKNRFTEYIFSSMKIENFNIVNKKFFGFRFTFFYFCGIIDETGEIIAVFSRFWGIF